jgi:tRNA(His) guanylyltransferase
MSDPLGDRMKLYENLEAGRRLMPLLPTLARIDGRAFHRFTRGMLRPFDSRFCICMQETTRLLVRDTGALAGYTQSDEITLLWHSTKPKSQIWFDGRVSKMTSQLGALSTLFFNLWVKKYLPDYAHLMPTFDARVWTVPNREEAANVFHWREQDATKNSLNMVASSVFSHRALHGKRSAEKHEMLHQKEINWADYPSAMKRGTYFTRSWERRRFTTEELEKLPPLHNARKDPNLLIERSEVVMQNLPPLARIMNVSEVLFDGAQPILRE